MQDSIRNIQLWLKETRANFLVLPVALVSLGGAAAEAGGIFIPWRFWVTLAGTVLAHISVNLFNEYSDWRTGIDAKTPKTPFSGGSGNLPAGLLNPAHVLLAAWISIFLAFLAGVALFRVTGWPVLVFMGIGGFSAILYTDLLARWILGELFAGIALGSLVVAGAFYVQTGTITPGIVWASVPPGILTALLLFLNEFPDMEADRAGGRKHLVIGLGRKRSGLLYAFLLMCVYLCIGLGVFIGGLPTAVLVSFLTLPLGVAAAYRAIRHAEDMEQLLPALGMNVAVVLGTDFLMAAGFLLA